jgi:hypothetical protein
MPLESMPNPYSDLNLAPKSATKAGSVISDLKERRDQTRLEIRQKLTIPSEDSRTINRKILKRC